ncbi:uncharacterized protein [Panulirus ornatus]|uniref:uncharacterized protein n=1 Tax=Panulirus ornatus TaxID=150431 RepID=UPI003A87C4D6
MTDCAPGNYLSMVDNSDVGLSYYRGKCSMTPHSLEEKMGEIRKPKDTVSMENRLGIEHPPESSKPPCSLLQYSWEQKMGGILGSKGTTGMETKLIVESLPDPPKPHSLLNGQVSTLTCPPVVPHQEACGLPDQKSLAKHITHFKRAKLCYPVLKLHRLQAKDFRRFRDLARVGINKESARRLRKQLQKFTRNERRRNRRKVDKSLLNWSKFSAKKVDLCSEDFVKSEDGEKSVFRSSLKPRKKLPRPTANGSITGADVKEKPAKKGRQPQFDAHPSPNSTDMRVHSALNLPRPTVLPFQSHAAAVPPPMMTLPWISPAPSLFSHSPYVPCPPATPLILPSRDLLASPLSKVHCTPPMIPLDKIQAPVFAMTQSGKKTTPDLETHHGKLSNTTPVAIKHENYVSSPSYVPHLGRLPVSSHGLGPQQGKIPALSSLTPKLENPPPPPSMTHHPSYLGLSGKVLSSAKAPHSQNASIPSSVACRPPPLIPLPLSRENLGIYNTTYSDTSDISSGVVSSKMTQRQSQKEMAVPDPSKISSQISVTSPYPSNAELHRESFAHQETDKTSVQKKCDPSRAESPSTQRTSNSSHMPSVSSQMSSVIPQTVTSTSQDSLILSVPKILPKASAPSVGLTISPMVLIPASVAFESLNSQKVTHTSQMTANASQVRPKIQASIPVSSVTSGVPPQYYWIVTPKLSKPSTTVSAASPVDSSQKSVIDNSLSKTATSAIRTISQSPAMTSALPVSQSSSQHSIIGPPPVSSSSYLASLLKAGVPLVPVSSSVDSVISTSSGLSTSSASTTNVSGASLPVTISVSTPIMSTPPIIAHQKNTSPHDSGEDYKPSHVGHTGVEKQAHIVTSAAKSPPTLNSQPSDPISVPSKHAQAAVTGADDSAPKKPQTALNVVTTSALPTSHKAENVKKEEDSVRINDIISAVLGKTSAVRLIMESVSSDQRKGGWIHL